MKYVFKNYLNAFKGLSKEVWWLALITLINRAGTMVIPFLSLYLSSNLGFTLVQVGWIMSCFGLGSVAGSWLGGKLTDRIGYYKIMIFSLFSSGILFVALQFLETFYSVAAGIFVLMIIADMFRPAMFIALSAYSKPKNKTRSVSLIRLAINLGFSAGPAIGGLLIATMGYAGLFWVDGITCILAGFLLLQVLNPKTARVQEEVKVPEHPVSAYRDKPFWIFFIAMALFGMVFIQYFSMMTVYYETEVLLSELEIGLLLGMNGLFIAVLEMPLVKSLENSKLTKTSLIIYGAILTALSFFVLNLDSGIGVVILGMLFMTVGEMLAFPYSNAFAMQRAKKGHPGEYMALYSIAFSLAHVFGHKLGADLISAFGFTCTWYVFTGIMLVGIGFLYWLKLVLKREKAQELKANQLRIQQH
jgi:predicted MFS family arabinose efflux permease